MHSTDFATQLDQRLAKIQHFTPQVAVRSQSLGIDYRYGDTDLPFHATSVGKLITSALVMQQVEAGCFALATPIAELLPASEIDGLFADDAAAEVTIEQLLTHTSGCNDFYEGRTKSGPRFVAELKRDLDREWSPAELIAFTRDRQQPVARPGERFRYSDTGFVLLGRALETVTGELFGELVHHRVFAPLGMGRSFLPFRTQPASGTDEIASLSIAGIDIGTRRAITCDWAGGGIAGTLDDFLQLMAGMRNGKLISAESWAMLREPRHRFRPGLWYGAGTMTVRFEGLVPWARNWPRLVGHLGSSAAHLWHDPVHDAEIAINFGSSKAVSRSFRTLYEVVSLLRQL